MAPAVAGRGARAGPQPGPGTRRGPGESEEVRGAGRRAACSLCRPEPGPRPRAPSSPRRGLNGLKNLALGARDLLFLYVSGIILSYLTRAVPPSPSFVFLRPSLLSPTFYLSDVWVIRLLFPSLPRSSFYFFPLHPFLVTFLSFAPSLFPCFMSPLFLSLALCQCASPSPSFLVLSFPSTLPSSISWAVFQGLLCVCFLSSFPLQDLSPPPRGFVFPAAPPPHPSQEMNMSPYWMPWPEPGEGARPA